MARGRKAGQPAAERVAEQVDPLGDPLAQRGTVGWKLWQGTIILQDAFMARLEVGCTA